MRLCIDNVPSDATERDIRQLFSGYGEVLSVTFPPGPLHNKQPRSGLIELKNIKIEHVGMLPDRCLFRGKVVRITQDRSAIENRTCDHQAAFSGSNASVPRQPDNRDKNTLHVVSIEEVVDPSTGKPNGWCRYSIKSLAGTIAGLRHGTAAEVTLYAEEAAEAFNLRNMLGHCKPPAWSSHRKK